MQSASKLLYQNPVLSFYQLQLDIHSVIFELIKAQTHGSFITWLSIEGNYRQDLIFALNAPAASDFSALKQTELTCERPYYKRAMT